jgi:hypothetical protein
MAFSIGSRSVSRLDGKGCVVGGIEHLARIIWLGRYSEENIMGMFYAAYFDASGKEDCSPVLTIAGAVAPLKKWIRFERQWKDALADEGVAEYHANTFNPGEGEFKSWKQDKARRSKFLTRLNKIIKDNTNKVFSTTIEIEGWCRTDKEFFLTEAFHSPYALAGYTVVYETIKWAKRKGVAAQVEYIFEEGDEGWKGLTILCARHRIVPIRLPKSKAIPCQAGDLLAWKSRNVAVNALKDIAVMQNAKPTDALRSHFQRLVISLASHDDLFPRPAVKGIYSYENLVQTCLNFKVPRRSEVDKSSAPTFELAVT